MLRSQMSGRPEWTSVETLTSATSRLLNELKQAREYGEIALGSDDSGADNLPFPMLATLNGADSAFAALISKGNEDSWQHSGDSESMLLSTALQTISLLEEGCAAWGRVDELFTCDLNNLPSSTVGANLDQNKQAIQNVLKELCASFSIAIQAPRVVADSRRKAMKSQGQSGDRRERVRQSRHIVYKKNPLIHIFQLVHDPENPTPLKLSGCWSSIATSATAQDLLKTLPAANLLGVLILLPELKLTLLVGNLGLDKTRLLLCGLFRSFNSDLGLPLVVCCPGQQGHSQELATYRGEESAREHV
ncbi:hypothetical protein IWZ01DRAFT_89753 [Phyllosticta capitalensis]